MLSILIVEPHGSGHRANYVRLMADGLLARGHHVTIGGCADLFENVLLRELVPPRAGRLHIAAHPGAVSPVFATSASGLVLQEIRYRRLFASLLKDAGRSRRIDAIVLPFADYCLHAMAFFGSPFGEVAWCGITMKTDLYANEHGVVHIEPGWRGRLRATAIRRLCKQPQMRRLFSLHPLSDAYAADAHLPVGKFEYLPDPAVPMRLRERCEARAELGLPAGALCLLVYGSLGPRKGVQQLLAALTEKMPPDLFLILAGRQTEETRMLLAGDVAQRLRCNGRLIEIDVFLDDDAEALVFSAADIVWLGYRNHLNMSGVLVLAGQAQLPVIACREGVIGALTEAHQLGWVVDPDVPASVLEAIDALRDPEARQCLGANGARRFATHTHEDVVEKILNVFPPAAASVTAGSS